MNAGYETLATHRRMAIIGYTGSKLERQS